MALSPRQAILYTDTCDLYRPVETLDGADKTVLNYTYTLAESGVACYFRIRGSVSGPSTLGQIEGDNMFSVDTIHMDVAQTIDEDWVALNTTAGANYGRYWKIRGQPRTITRRGNRRAERRECAAIQIQDPPQGIPRLV